MIGVFENYEEKSMRLKVLDIKRLIAAVSALARQHRVVFDLEAYGGCYAQNRVTRRRCKNYPRNGIYELPVWIRKPQVFGGQPPTTWAQDRRNVILLRPWLRGRRDPQGIQRQELWQLMKMELHPWSKDRRHPQGMWRQGTTTLMDQWICG